MIVLAQAGHTAPHIARLVLRSEDTVERVLKRFLTGGLDAVPRRSATSAERVASHQRGRAELVRVIELDPARRWVKTRPTGRPRCLPTSLRRQTGVTVSLETVRVYLHAHGYVCKRPTWTLRRKAEEKADYVGNARLGRGSVGRCHRTRTSPRQRFGGG